MAGRVIRPERNHTTQFYVVPGSCAEFASIPEYATTWHKYTEVFVLFWEFCQEWVVDLVIRIIVTN
jgi:hypothetical protein